MSHISVLSLIDPTLSKWKHYMEIYICDLEIFSFVNMFGKSFCIEINWQLHVPLDV